MYEQFRVYSFESRPVYAVFIIRVKNDFSTGPENRKVRAPKEGDPYIATSSRRALGRQRNSVI